MQLPPSIGLRPIAEQDLPLLRRIYSCTREHELAQVDYWTADDKERFLDSQFDLQHRYYQAHFPHGEFFVVERHGEHLENQGIGRLYLDTTGVDLRLIDIALLPAWRNQGIGSGILSGVLAMADECGQEVLLHVEVNNPVLSLYRRLGFVTVADSGVYLKLRRPCKLAA
jgi:ribosomal protein S18 acetylase RimI-like enzyme